MRKSAEKHGVPNASHMAWVWETLSFDQSTHEETVLSRFYLDEHGMLVKASASFSRAPGADDDSGEQPGLQHDIANSLKAIIRRCSRHRWSIRR